MRVLFKAQSFFIYLTDHGTFQLSVAHLTIYVKIIISLAKYTYMYVRTYIIIIRNNCM